MVHRGFDIVTILDDYWYICMYTISHAYVHKTRVCNLVFACASTLERKYDRFFTNSTTVH
jgi:hypothetical protein